MRKLLWMLPLALLMACGAAPTELVPPETNANANTAVSTTNDSAATTSGETSILMSATDLDNFAPASSIPEASETRAQDWRKGSTDPLVVIIEYGDFQ